MNTMVVMQVAAAGTAFSLVQKPIPQPGPGEVRIRVKACGICHSDALTQQGHWPGITYPRAPGHEVAGVIDALGTGVTTWKAGARVGVGWNGGFDGTCAACLRGDFLMCANHRIPGISYDGGYQEYMIAPANVLAPIPDELSFEEAAPLLCAGVTTYNSLRHSGARAGDLVAILGVGGLGHLGVQFASKMRLRTVAIARGRNKEELARKLGATEYIDSQSDDVAARLQALGGARVVLATVTSAKAMAATIDGLGVDGELWTLGASAEPLEVSVGALIGRRRSIRGWPSGTAADSADTLRFAVQTGVRPMIETMPLEKAQEAYDKMMRGDARFRMVLTPAG
jgi:D-arabinose 1-dehydrogenase-like Zn-dependent alcohol dehydrogenase